MLQTTTYIRKWNVAIKSAISSFVNFIVWPEKWYKIKYIQIFMTSYWTLDATYTLIDIANGKWPFLVNTLPIIVFFLNTYSKHVAILITICLLCYILLEMDCIFYMYHAAAVRNSGCNGNCILGLHPFDERRRYFVMLVNSILHYPCPVCWSPHARQPRVTTPSQDDYIQILQLCDGLRPVSAIAYGIVGLFNERICPQPVQNRLRGCDCCARRPRHGLHSTCSTTTATPLGQEVHLLDASTIEECSLQWRVMVAASPRCAASRVTSHMGAKCWHHCRMKGGTRWRRCTVVWAVWTSLTTACQFW